MSLHRALLEAVAVWSLGATACTAKVHNCRGWLPLRAVQAVGRDIAAHRCRPFPRSWCMCHQHCLPAPWPGLYHLGKTLHSFGLSKLYLISLPMP